MGFVFFWGADFFRIFYIWGHISTQENILPIFSLIFSFSHLIAQARSDQRWTASEGGFLISFFVSGEWCFTFVSEHDVYCGLGISIRWGPALYGMRFTIYWEDWAMFVFYFTQVVFCFSGVKPTSRYWEEFHLVMVCYHLFMCCRPGPVWYRLLPM